MAIVPLTSSSVLSCYLSCMQDLHEQEEPSMLCSSCLFYKSHVQSEQEHLMEEEIRGGVAVLHLSLAKWSKVGVMVVLIVSFI